MAVSHKKLGIVANGELIDVPVEATPVAGYIAERVRVHLAGSSLPPTIQKIQSGLVSVNATLASGKPVASTADVCRWCIEQVCAAAVA